MKQLLSLLAFITGILVVSSTVQAENPEDAEVIRYETRPESIQEFKVKQNQLMQMQTYSLQRTLLTQEENSIFADWIGLLDRNDVQKVFYGGPSFHSIYSKTFSSVYNNKIDTGADTFTHVEARSGGYIHFIMPSQLNIDSAYISARAGSSTDVTFNFFDGDNNLIKTSIVNFNSNGNESKKLVVNAFDVKKIEVLASRFMVISEIEFDVLENYQAVETVTYTATDRTAELNWVLPIHAKLQGIKVNGKNVGMTQQSTVSNLIPNKKNEVTITAVYEDGVEIDSIITIQTKPDITPPEDVKNLKVTKVASNSAKLTFERPKDKDYSYAAILVNGAKFGETQVEEFLTFVQDGKIYDFKVVAYDDQGNASNGVTIKLDLKNREVTNLRAKAEDFTKVELSWNNPILSEFDHVTIYRKKNDTGMMYRVRTLFASDTYTPIFETNGTVFKDLTVEEDTAYTYKLTTRVNEDESSGVTVDVKTPKLKVIGPEFNISGEDYILTWSAPTTGKLKVVIDGEEFTTTEAAEQKITIPRDKMKYDIFDSPRLDLIQLIPIKENGEEGEPTKVPHTGSGGSIGGLGGINSNHVLSAKNLLLTGVGILSVVGIFVLLGLAFPLAKRLIDFLRKKVIKHTKYRRV